MVSSAEHSASVKRLVQDAWLTTCAQIKALLAADSEEFFDQCDPSSENLVAYVCPLSLPCLLRLAAEPIKHVSALALHKVSLMQVFLARPAAGSRRRHLVSSVASRRSPTRTARAVSRSACAKMRKRQMSTCLSKSNLRRSHMPSCFDCCRHQLCTRRDA